jgi:curved DNA-binding protein CbpA
MTDPKAFDPYAVLGLERTATQEEVKAAYRSESQKAHPDRAGGSAERMTEVNRAYQILGDPEDRAEFDRTGGTGAKASVEAKARDLMISLLKMILRGTPPGVDIVQLLRDGLVNQRKGCRESRMKTQSDLALLRDRLRRLKGPPENFLETAILQEIARGEEHLPVYDADEAVLVKAFEILAQYSYDTRYTYSNVALGQSGGVFGVGLLGNLGPG